MTASRLWLLLAALGVLVLPWHLPQDGGVALIGLGARERDSGSALWQAVAYGRFWFWPAVAALALALPGVLVAGARGGRWLVAGGAFGLLAVAGQGLAIGLQGWSFALLERAFGPLDDRQLGMGLGAAAAVVGFLFALTTGLARRGAFHGDRFLAGAVGAIFALIAVFTLWPVLSILAQMFTPRGNLTLAASFAARAVDARIWGLGCVGGGTSCGVLWNTLALAVATATASTVLGLAFALVVLRTGFPARRALRFLTVLPIITPPFVIGLGLILIFGRSGLVNQLVEAVSGIQLGRWIYGGGGVFLAQVFSFTPTAFLVMIGVVEGISPTLEEASQTLRGGRMRTFRAVTLPLMLPGLANAWLVCFVESLADFGNPIVLGGSYGVLSTEIFFAVVGAQQDFGRAAVLASLLLALAVIAFLIQRAVIGRRSYVSVAGKGDAGVPARLPRGIALLAYALALPWAVLTIVVYSLALAGGFVRIWGRDWTLTLQHFHTAFALEATRDGLLFAGQAWQSLGTTLMLAGIAAPLAAALGLTAAWLLSRQRFTGRTVLEFAIMLTFAVPGTVLGVAYILTYNVPPLEITGTAFILIACFVFRNLPVGLRSGLAAMSQIDRSLDEAAVMLRASTARTLTRVVLPLIKPAIMTALIYAFVRSMTTVSAVIFLVSAQYEMATVFIVNRVVAGDYGVAIAYCSVLIALMVAVIALVQLAVGERRFGRRAAPAPARQLA